MVGLTMGETDVPTNYIFAGGQNIIFDGDPNKGIFFSPMALENSFWASQGVQAGDIIKKVNGKDLTLENAQQVIGGMYGWQEGMEYSLDLERNGEAVVLKGTLGKATAKSESLVEDENATEAQKALRQAWLKG